MNWHAKFGAVLAIFDFSKKVRGRSCPQPFICFHDPLIFLDFIPCSLFTCGRRGGLMFSELDSRASAPGGHFLIRGYWGCAAVWGRILTTGLTIMGSHFQ